MDIRRMSPSMIALVVEEENKKYQRGVKHLCDNGLTKVPTKYIWPETDRPIFTKPDKLIKPKQNLKLPIIDIAELLGPNRSHVLRTIAEACENYGFFQVVNHGMVGDVSRNMIEVCKKFFELPYEERSKYMTSDMSAPVRSLAAIYAKETKEMFDLMVKAILESLEIDGEGDKAAEELKEGSQLVVVNCYPPCPQPELTLGMPPHSDYGFVTLLLQDDVEGLQIMYRDEWVTVDPIPGSFVVNVGDHLEIFSNGRYKSVLHRVLVNSTKPRISVASLHSFPLTSVVKPSPKLTDKHNPPQYMDTDFATFLQYISSREPKWKNFLESRKIHHIR
ncbi:hypothetical protein YC2023_049259 [Brassica napus]